MQTYLKRIKRTKSQQPKTKQKKIKQTHFWNEEEHLHLRSVLKSIENLETACTPYNLYDFFFSLHISYGLCNYTKINRKLQVQHS